MGMVQRHMALQAVRNMEHYHALCMASDVAHPNDDYVDTNPEV